MKEFANLRIVKKFEKIIESTDEEIFNITCENYSEGSFFVKNYQKLNWRCVSLNKFLPMQFFVDNKNKLVWKVLPQNKMIPLWFYEENIDRVDWTAMSMYCNMPLWFVKKYENKIDKSSLRWNHNIHYTCLNYFFDWRNTNRFYNIPEEFIIKNTPEYTKFKDYSLTMIRATKIITEKLIPMRQKIYRICELHVPDEWIIDIVKRGLVDLYPRAWHIISGNTHLSLEFFEMYFDKLDLKELARCINLTDDFVERHYDDFKKKDCLTMIMCHSSLSTSFLEKHVDDVNVVHVLTSGRKLDPSFILKHIDKVPESEKTFINFDKFVEREYDKFIKKNSSTINIWHPSIPKSLIENSIANVLTSGRKLDPSFISKHINKVPHNLLIFVNFSEFDISSIDLSSHARFSILNDKNFWINTHYKMDHVKRMYNVLCELTYKPCFGVEYNSCKSHFESIIFE